MNARLSSGCLIIIILLLGAQLALQLIDRSAATTRAQRRALKLADLSDACKKAIYGEEAKSAMQQIVGSTECIRTTLSVLADGE